MLLPTVFLGLEFLVAAVLETGVLETSLEGVGLLSLERLGVFVSAALVAVGFLAVTSDFEADLGVSGFADFIVEDGRVRGDSGFLAAVVADLVTSFLTGVVFLDVCDAGALPPEGVVEVGLEAAGLAVVEVLGVAGLAVAVELLVAVLVGGRVEPVAGRDVAAVPVAGLVVLETGGLSGLGEAVELGLVGVAEAGLEAGGFLAAAALVLTSLAVVVFLVAVVVDFAPLVAVEAFFSPTLAAVLEAGAPAVPVGFLEGAEVVLLFLSGAGVVFLATPLVWGLDTPFERRLWDVLGREPDVVLVEVAVPGFVLAVALLVVLALASSEVLLLVLAAGVSLACSGWGSTWSISAAGCCAISSSAGLPAWLGSCPAPGAASFTGLDSNVSIGSSAAVATPSGFISP